MKIWTEENNENVIVYCQGDIDEHTAYELRTFLDKLIVARIKSLQLSMKYVDFMDSTGIGMILGRYKKTSQLGINFSISDVKPQIDKILRISGIYQIIPLVR